MTVDAGASAGEQVLNQMQATMGSLSSYRLDESLTSGLGTAIQTNYAFAIPNSFESRAINSGKTFGIVWIGDTRWLRKPNGTWEVEQGAPAPPVPSYIWDYFKPYRDVRIIGSETVEGVPTTEIAFAGGQQDLPVWFKLWVDTQGLVHRAEMRAPGHFMDHRYYDFDTPITISPPTNSGAAG